MKKLALILYIILSSITAHPQRVSHVFRGESLAEVLKTLDRESDEYRISFIFDELEDFVVTTSFKNKTIPAAIRDAVGFYPIRIITDHSGSNIFVECTQKGGKRLIGRIVDQHAQPVIYANIALLNPEDSTLVTGGVSNESGDFVIPTSRSRVLMRVSCVGYRTLYHLAEVGAVGTIRMRTSTVPVRNVTVKAHRPAYRIGKEGLVAGVQGTNLSHAGTAEDVLGMLPDITAEDGHIAVFGRAGRPVIYINSKKVLNRDELTLLKSEEIANVEVIASPATHYGAAVTAVIRIRTVRKKGEGWSGNFETEGRIGRFGSGNANASLNYRTGGLDVSGSMTCSMLHRRQEQDTYWDIRGIVEKNSVLCYDDRTSKLGGRFRINYEFCSAHSAGLTCYVRRMHSVGQGNSRIKGRQQGGTDEKYTNRMSMERKGKTMPTICMYYNGTVGRINIDLDADFVYARNRIGNDSHIEKEQGVYAVNSLNNNCTRMFAIKSVMAYSCYKGKASVGLEHVRTIRSSIFTGSGGIESISDDEIRERTSAMFAEYALTAGDFSAAAGIRYEHTGTQYYRFGVFSHEQSNRYRGWYPSLSARYSKGRTSCRMGYTTGTQRPAYENLTGNRLYEDEHIYEGGNPLLRFSKVHTLSLEAQHGGITMLCTYADVHNDVAWIDRIYGGKAILYTPVNIQRRRNLHLMLTYSERIGRWHPRYSAGMSRQIFDLSQEGITARMDKPYWTFKFSNTFYLPGGIHAALRYDCTTAGNELTAYNRARHALSLTMHKTFLADRLSVRIKAADIFKTYRNSGIYRGAYMTVDRKAYTDTRFISLTVSYRFNTTDSKYKGTGAGESEKGRL